MKLDAAYLAHRLHVLGAARHMLSTARAAGTAKPVLKAAIVNLCLTDFFSHEEAEALIADFELKGV